MMPELGMEMFDTAMPLLQPEGHAPKEANAEEMMPAQEALAEAQPAMPDLPADEEAIMMPEPVPEDVLGQHGKLQHCWCMQQAFQRPLGRHIWHVQPKSCLQDVYFCTTQQLLWLNRRSCCQLCRFVISTSCQGVVHRQRTVQMFARLP